jgi:predicted Zn finger-like uncharacterized protein
VETPAPEKIAMPLTIKCPSCSAKLKLTDNAAGRQVKCPSCHTPIIVAADPAPPPVPVVAPVEDGEEDTSLPPDDQSQPERPRRRKKKKGNTGLLIGLGVGALALLGVCCIGGGAAFYFLRDSGPGGGSFNLLANNNPKVTKANYDRLQEGMGLAEVEAILGKGSPTNAAEVRKVYSTIQTMTGPMQVDGRTGSMYDRASAQGALYRWRNGDNYIFVVFTAPPSAGGKLTYRFIQEKNGNNVSSTEGGTIK